MIATGTLRQAEDIKHASLRRCFLQIRHGVDKPERRRSVAWIEVACDNRAGPSAHAAQHGHVLMSVRPAVADRLTDDSGAGPELPQQFSSFRVDCFEPTLHRAVEDDVAGGRDHTAPDREVLFDRPALLRVLDIPSAELAAVAARAGL